MTQQQEFDYAAAFGLLARFPGSPVANDDGSVTVNIEHDDGFRETRRFKTASGSMDEIAAAFAATYAPGGQNLKNDGGGWWSFDDEVSEDDVPFRHEVKITYAKVYR